MAFYHLYKMEYKLLILLTASQRVAIIKIIEQHPLLYSTYNDFGNEAFELRHVDNTDFLPDTSITIEPDGLYICQNSHKDIWHNIEQIKSFITTQALEFDILVDEEA